MEGRQFPANTYLILSYGGDVYKRQVYPLSNEGETPDLPEKRGDKQLPGSVLYLKFPSLDHPSVRHMKLVFNMFPGTTQVKMVMADTRKVYATQVLLHQALVAEAQETLGPENVVVK